MAKKTGVTVSWEACNTFKKWKISKKVTFSANLDHLKPQDSLLQVSHSVESTLRAADHWGSHDSECATRGTPSGKVLVPLPVRLPRHGQRDGDVQRRY